MLTKGTRIQITGLQSSALAHMNGLEGVIDRYSTKKGKYVVSFSTGPMMVSEQNIAVLEGHSTGDMSSFGTIFLGEEEMMQQLKSMGMSEEQLGNLTPEQRKLMLNMTRRDDIIQRAQETPGVIAQSQELNEEGGGLYKWKDVKTHVYMEMSDKTSNGMQCTITKDNICITDVESRDILLQGELFQHVDVEKCVWETIDGNMIITLVKAKPMRWLMVIKS